jgi:predicted Zn-dependent protease
VIRALGAAAAVIVAAWFALGAYQAVNQADARDEIARLPAPTAAQTREIKRRLDRADTLNPDRGVTILRARAALQEPDLPRAVQLLQGVVRDEPENLEAWSLLAFATLDQPGEKALHDRAEAAQRRLSPPVPNP